MMNKSRFEKIVRELKEYNSEDRVGKKYHAWKTLIYPEHISNEYLGIIEYIGKTDSIVNPFLVKLEGGEESVAGTVDFFSDINDKPFSWCK